MNPAVQTLIYRCLPMDGHISIEIMTSRGWHLLDRFPQTKYGLRRLNRTELRLAGLGYQKQ